jgi:hypothetical protein
MGLFFCDPEMGKKLAGQRKIRIMGNEKIVPFDQN